MNLMPPPWLTALAVALVWLYEGLWCKVLGRSRHEREVVATAAWPPPRFAGLFLRALGVFECGLAVWVLSGRQPLFAALVQSGLLIALNTAGVGWSRHLIPDPAGLVIKNFAFLVLVWVAAGQAA